MSNLEGLVWYGDSTLDDYLVNNINTFIKHGLLEIGAFINITKGQVNYNGADMSLLRPLTAPGVTGYTVYRDVNNDWIWESGVSLKYPSGTAPIIASGVYVNNIYRPDGSGCLLDFSRGQVIFTSGLNANDSVQISRALRGVHVYKPDEHEARTIITNWREFNNTSGTSNYNYRAYLPCITTEILGYKTIRGTELGSRAKNINIQFEFNIWSENAYEQKKLTDIIYNLEEKYIQLFDIDSAPKPLDGQGRLVRPTGCTWTELIAHYPGGGIRFESNFSSIKIKNVNNPIYLTKCKISACCDVFPI